MRVAKKLLVQLVLDLALDLFVDELVKPQCIYRRGNRKNSGSTAPVINLSQLYATCNSSLQTEMLDTQEYDRFLDRLLKWLTLNIMKARIGLAIIGRTYCKITLEKSI